MAATRIAAHGLQVIRDGPSVLKVFRVQLLADLAVRLLVGEIVPEL